MIEDEEISDEEQAQEMMNHTLYKKFLDKQKQAHREKMKKMEEEMEKEMGGIIVDASKTESLTLRKANTTFDMKEAEGQSTKNTSKNSKP